MNFCPSQARLFFVANDRCSEGGFVWRPKKVIMLRSLSKVQQESQVASRGSPYYRRGAWEYTLTRKRAHGVRKLSVGLLDQKNGTGEVIDIQVREDIGSLSSSLD